MLTSPSMPKVKKIIKNNCLQEIRTILLVFHVILPQSEYTTHDNRHIFSLILCNFLNVI